MPDPLSQPLHGWDTFYFLMGGAAAGLVGLTFVAITVGSGLITKRDMAGLRTFLNPTLIHFVYVLVTAAIAVVPTVTRIELGVLLTIGGVISSALVCLGVPYMWHQSKAGVVDTRDWIWYFLAPLACYLTYLGTGIGLLEGHAWAVNALAWATVVLLIAGIRNTWDMVLWFMILRGGRPGENASGGPPTAPTQEAGTESAPSSAG